MIPLLEFLHRRGGFVAEVARGLLHVIQFNKALLQFLYVRALVAHRCHVRQRVRAHQSVVCFFAYVAVHRKPVPALEHLNGFLGNAAVFFRGFIVIHVAQLHQPFLHGLHLRAGGSLAHGYWRGRGLGRGCGVCCLGGGGHCGGNIHRVLRQQKACNLLLRRGLAPAAYYYHRHGYHRSRRGAERYQRTRLLIAHAVNKVIHNPAHTARAAESGASPSRSYYCALEGIACAVKRSFQLLFNIIEHVSAPILGYTAFIIAYMRRKSF